MIPLIGAEEVKLGGWVLGSDAGEGFDKCVLSLEALEPAGTDNALHVAG